MNLASTHTFECMTKINLKVTCSTFPVESPEDVTTVSTWKRSFSSTNLFRVHATRSCLGFLSCKPSTSTSPLCTSSSIFMATFRHFWRPASSIGRDFHQNRSLYFLPESSQKWWRSGEHGFSNCLNSLQGMSAVET